MPDQTGRFDWLKKISVVMLVALLAMLAVAMACTISNLIVAGMQGRDGSTVLRQVAWLLAELAGIAGAFVLFGLVRVAAEGTQNLLNIAAQSSRLESLLEDQASSARKLADLATLTEEAKSLLYRDRELEAVREMMHGMLVRQDYKTAEEFLAEIEKKPTLAVDVYAMRKELDDTRRATIDGKIDLALSRVDEIISRHDWARALREASRVRAAFPNNPRVTSLSQRIESARMKHKRDLLQAYGEAVAKNDVDGSIELLKELDRYLSPQEAAALQDSARGVFKAKLHNLGVQFAIRVAEGQWNEALLVGEEIVREYPNSRMAHEVLAKMDQLRQRAATPAPAKA